MHSKWLYSEKPLSYTSLILFKITVITVVHKNSTSKINALSPLKTNCGSCISGLLRGLTVQTFIVYLTENGFIVII